MAIDYKALQVKVDALQEKLSELRDLIRVGRDGKVYVDLVGDINFTTAQKTALITKYNEIKAEMAAGNLPAKLPFTKRNLDRYKERQSQTT